MDRLRLKGEGGFTLIELLVVIAIIGILAAIAIPQFAAYRKRGFEANVKADLRNVATAEEAYFVTSNTYRACTACTATNLPGYNKSAQVAVDSSGGASAFTLTATHANCGTTTWTYQSTTGSIVGPTTGCP
jgi:type IV pilus assembly protein PilA